MPFNVKSYALASKDSPVAPYELERRDLLPDDVLIKISYCGVCHSDLHTGLGDWGMTPYPFVPGHEIVGVAEEVGKDVTDVKVGDVVAVGCLVDSCGKCTSCNIQQEQLCLQGATQTYAWPDLRSPGKVTAGGYSEKIVVQHKFVLKVPKALQTKELLPGVAPILCAGITTFSCLRQYGVTKGAKVAILGMGGLGSMGIKLASALGADVTLVSRSHGKDELAKSIGAKDVIASGDAEEMKKNANRFDVIVDTIPQDHDLNVYLPLVAQLGTLVVVGQIGNFSTPLNSLNLLVGNKKLAGSVIGGIKETQELLDLCAEHSIIAEHELIPITKINEAWKEIGSGNVSKRYIIDISTL